MKSKLSLIAIPTILLLVVFFVTKKNTDKLERSAPKIALGSLKCTPTNFLLDDIDTTQQIAPLFDDLGMHYFTISTNTKESQIFFNQGLNLTYAFNHTEAHRSYMEASRLDANAAMTYWGQAYVLGPNINDHFPDKERRDKAYEALQKAKGLAPTSSAKEQALIDALTHRYSKDSVDVKALNMAYMEAMTTVVETYPNDADILTLYAAAVMNTVPWNYWDKDGNPSPNIKEAKLALEKAMEVNIDHPGANHYYIHMVELPKPDLGEPAADRLGTLMPGAGHLVHMPGHIYMRVGRYEDAVKANQLAILADEDYIAQCFAQGMYPLAYYPHNIHFLWSSASMLGDSKMAIDAAKKTAEKVPIGDLEGNQYYQNFTVTPILAYTRFGLWNEILTTPNPGAQYTYLNLILNYTRGIAFCRKGNLKDAQEELVLIAERDTSLDHEKIALVAYEVLAGEIEVSKGNLSSAIEHLEKAVAFEDKLPYDEPALWYIPTRQTLGAILLKAEKYEEAEIIYLEDLDYYRQNGWSLMGLYQSLLGQGKDEEAEIIKLQFDEAWSKADIEISSSIL
jgi:tetratricopeptide (TPR) repeat protein